MAEIHGSLSRVYMRGIDISSLFTDIEAGFAADILDTTTFSATADSHIVSPISKGNVSADGMLDVDESTGAHTTLQMLEAATASTAGTSLIVHMVRDTTLGDPGFALIGSVPKLTVKNPLRDVAHTTLDAQSKKHGWCRSLKPKAAITGAGSATGLTNTASTANGGISILSVFALSGTTPVITVKTQHSSDSTNGVDGVWVDLATHTAINAAGVTAGYGEGVAVTGTVNKYLRHTLAVTSGSLTSITLAHQFIRFP